MNLSSETHGFINADRLKLFKNQTVPLNCPGVIWWTAPLWLQRSRPDKSPAMAPDILDEEPAKPDYPLLKCRNAVMTPQIG